VVREGFYADMLGLYSVPGSFPMIRSATWFASLKPSGKYLGVRYHDWSFAKKANEELKR